MKSLVKVICITCSSNPSDFWKLRPDRVTFDTSDHYVNMDSDPFLGQKMDFWTDPLRQVG